MQETLEILIIEDNPGDSRLIAEMLTGLPRQKFSMDYASTLSAALLKISENRYDLALLDLNLSDSWGVATIQPCLDAAPELPIIVLTGSEDEAIGLQAVRSGAQDFIFKGDLEARMLTRLINYAIERKFQETKLKKMARTDDLTNLRNRRCFLESLERAHQHAVSSCSDLAVFFIDIDNYKLINDVHGHVAGDEVLCVVASRIKDCVRYEDYIGRLGGDEFSVFMHAPTHTPVSIVAVANKLLQKIIEPINLKSTQTAESIKLTASIGISIMSENDISGDLSPEGLLNNADTAMYKAKSNGGNDYRFYDKELEWIANNRMKIAVGLTHALEREEFSLVYQPIVESIGGELRGIEVLLRWEPVGGGSFSPAEFVPMLEDSYQIVPVGEWVLEEACKNYRELVDKWNLPESIWVCINFSPRQFREPNLLQMMERVMTQYQIPPDVLHMEITEGTMMEDTEQMIELMHEIKNLGIRIAIDDFGTGFSSMAYLKEMPVDYLKIDLSFILAYLEDDMSRVITGAMIVLAHELGLSVIAEGIENKETSDLLRDANCFLQQGFYFAPPMNLKALSDWLNGEAREAI